MRVPYEKKIAPFEVTKKGERKVDRSNRKEGSQRMKEGRIRTNKLGGKKKIKIND